MLQAQAPCWGDSDFSLWCSGTGTKLQRSPVCTLIPPFCSCCVEISPMGDTRFSKPALTSTNVSLTKTLASIVVV